VALESDIRAVLDGAGGTWGVFARNLGTGETVAIDADTPMHTASAAKTFILVHYARLVAAGSCDPHRRITITADDQVLASELNDIGATDDAGPRTAGAIGERLYDEWGRT